MDIVLKRLPGARIEAMVTVPVAQVKRRAETLLTRLAQTVAVPGFRPGMAPRLLVIESAGLPEFKKQLVSGLVSVALSRLVTDNKLTPASEPRVQVVSFDLDATGQPLSPVRFNVSFEVMPAVSIPDYRKIKISSKEHSATQPKAVSEQDTEKVITQLRQGKAEMIAVSRPVAADDWVEVSFEGSLEGVPQERLSSEHYPLVVGSGVLIKGFEDKLIGMRLGERNQFELPVAKEAKPVTFRVTVHDHKGLKLPEVNDHFASLFGQPTLAALKTHLQQVVTKQREALARHQREDLVIKKLVAGITTELPPALVDRELDRMIGRVRDDVLSQGMSFEDYLAKQNQTVETFKQQFRNRAEYAVKIGLALGEVARREKIDPAAPAATAQVLERLLKFAVQS